MGAHATGFWLSLQLRWTQCVDKPSSGELTEGRGWYVLEKIRGTAYIDGLMK